MDIDNRVALFGRTNFRNDRRIFGIKQADRLAHMYVVGKTGTGKSTLLETLMRTDLRAGHGFALLDPHGDLVERVRSAVPPERRDDLVYFNVPDNSEVMAFNPLAPVPPAARPLVASGLIQAFKKIWADSWGPRMEHILRNALLTLLDQPETTLADVLGSSTMPAFAGPHSHESRTRLFAASGSTSTSSTSGASGPRQSPPSKTRSGRFSRTRP